MPSTTSVSYFFQIFHSLLGSIDLEFSRFTEELHGGHRKWKLSSGNKQGSVRSNLLKKTEEPNEPHEE